MVTTNRSSLGEGGRGRSYGSGGPVRSRPGSPEGRTARDAGPSGRPVGQPAVADSGPMRYRTSGSCGPSGNRSVSNSTSRSSRAPCRSANEVNSRWEAVLSGEIVVSRVVQSQLRDGPGGQSVEQGGGQPSTTVRLVDRHLPHEQRVRPVRAYVPGDEADRHTVPVPGDGRRGGEVPAPEQIAVGRVQVEGPSNPSLSATGRPRRPLSGRSICRSACAAIMQIGIYPAKFKIASPDGGYVWARPVLSRGRVLPREAAALCGGLAWSYVAKRAACYRVTIA